jgi:multisubunit Na+/H+ antiporter MnhG subunit
MIDLDVFPAESRRVLSYKLRYAGIALMGVFVASAAIGIIPLQLTQPDWYLKSIALLINNTPIGLAGLCLAWIALFLNPDLAEPLATTWPYRALCTFAFYLFILVVPVQITAAVLSYVAGEADGKTQLQELERQMKPVRAKIEAATSQDELSLIIQ